MLLTLVVLKYDNREDRPLRIIGEILTHETHIVSRYPALTWAVVVSLEASNLLWDRSGVQ